MLLPQTSVIMQVCGFSITRSPDEGGECVCDWSGSGIQSRTFGSRRKRYAHSHCGMNGETEAEEILLFREFNIRIFFFFLKSEWEEGCESRGC